MSIKVAIFLVSIALLCGTLAGAFSTVEFAGTCITGAAVDLNVLMTEGGHFVEVQGSGEESTFSEAELNTMLSLARGGIGELVAKQRVVIG